MPKCSLASGGCASDRSAAIACVASAASRRKHSPGAKHFSSSSSPSSSPLGYLASCSYSPELLSHAVNGAPHGTPMSNNMYRVGGKNCIPKSRQRSTFSSSSAVVVVPHPLLPAHLHDHLSYYYYLLISSTALLFCRRSLLRLKLNVSSVQLNRKVARVGDRVGQAVEAAGRKRD